MKVTVAKKKDKKFKKKARTDKSMSVIPTYYTAKE